MLTLSLGLLNSSMLRQVYNERFQVRFQEVWEGLACLFVVVVFFSVGGPWVPIYTGWFVICEPRLYLRNGWELRNEINSIM
jgi:hypothetical protein